MKRIYAFCLMLTMLLGLCFQAKSEVSVTIECETPQYLADQGEMGTISWEEVAVSTTRTSQVFTLDKTWGSLKLWPAPGYYFTEAVTSGGEKIALISAMKPNTFTFAENRINGVVINLQKYNGQTITLKVAKIERKAKFEIEIENGLSNILMAEFASGYAPALKKGVNEILFNPELDGRFLIQIEKVTPYSITLDGKEASTESGSPLQILNSYTHLYQVAEPENKKLFVQVFESAADEPQECKFTVEYGDGMEGCIYNIYNRTTAKFIELENNSIIVKEGTQLRVNLLTSDYTFTSLLLNGNDITDEMAGDAIQVDVEDPETVLRIEGKERVYPNINFTGYIVNGDKVNLSLSYMGEPFALPEGTAISNDIVVSDNLTMPAGETLKYTIPISEKYGKFFFSPQTGYYISNVYTRTPEGTIEQHSGSGSITAKIDGTTFYMMVEKLPEPYTANLTIAGSDFNMRISANSVVSDSWGNPSNPTYSSAEGEREISFIPGYGTPIVFGFVGEESQSPAVYLDGAQVEGTLNDNSGAVEFFVTPYSPGLIAGVAEGVKSNIEVYNSYKTRPTMSGASLQLEEGAEAEFFYSPVLHEADPAGQVVISGTQFTVRPGSPKMVVTYKNQPVELNENGEYVFTATGNARNNVVKVAPAPDAPEYPITPVHGSKVTNLSVIGIEFPGVEEVEYNDIAILLTGPETNFSTTDVHKSDKKWEANFRNPRFEGEYTVTFPAGAFILNGEPSLEAKAVYTFETGWTLLPAPDSTVENLDEIILSFPKAKDVKFVGSNYSFLLSKGQSYAVPGYNCEKVNDATVPTFRLTLPEGVVPPVGYYAFSVEEGTFLVDGEVSPEINVNYTIERESATDYIVSPEGMIIYQDYGYDFAVIFDEGTAVNGPIDASKIHISFDGTALQARDYSYGAEMNMLMFMITNKEYCKEGKIALNIEAEAFMLGTTPAPAVTAEWDVVAPRTYEVEVSTKGIPDSYGRVNDLSEIYLYFPEATTGEVFQPSGAQLRTRDYSYSKGAVITRDMTETEGVRFILTFDPAPEQSGDYSLSVHPGTFTLDGAFASPGIEATFEFDTLSGVTSIFADEDGCVTVFTLDGKAVMVKGEAEKLRGLDKGIYLINGKKTIVK